jgi:uracil-DNA glycosylase family 4
MATDFKSNKPLIVYGPPETELPKTLKKTRGKSIVNSEGKTETLQLLAPLDPILSAMEQCVQSMRAIIPDESMKPSMDIDVNTLDYSDIDIMFVATAPSDGEASTGTPKTPRKPALLSDKVGAMFERQITSIRGPDRLVNVGGKMISVPGKGLDIRKNCFYTTLIKYALHPKQKGKPTPDQIRLNSHLLDAEIARVRPKVIVCLGKPVFDYLSDYRLKMAEVRGGIFDYNKNDTLLCPKTGAKSNIKLFCMDDPAVVLYQPELLERFRVDLTELRLRVELPPGIPPNYKTITSIPDLRAWVDEMRNSSYRRFSVDCEWAGGNYVDGDLRYAQFCWAPGNAVCLALRGEAPDVDSRCPWRFGDATIQDVARELQFFNGDDIEWEGHNIHADSVWLKHHLGIDIVTRNSKGKSKIVFDTMYAKHTVNEYADLKLERLAVQYTDFGRYDIPLIQEKKTKKTNRYYTVNGYEMISDPVLEPYSMRDVDTVKRAVPYLIEELKMDGTYDYFMNTKLPFVTEGFADMMEVGIPVDLKDMEAQGEVFKSVMQILEARFLNILKVESRKLLVENCKTVSTYYYMDRCAHITDTDLRLETAYSSADKLSSEVGALYDLTPVERRFDVIRNFLVSSIGEPILDRPLDNMITLTATLEHMRACDYGFNHGSSDDMRRWLFKVKGRKPLVSTKALGVAVPWNKIEAMPDNKRKEYTPSTGKDTLEVIAANGDDTVSELLYLKSVSTIIRTFLRYDEDGHKKGLFEYVASDGRTHTNFAITETNRPRSYKPNILNIPKYLAKNIVKGFTKAQDEYEKQLEGLQLKPLRWNFKAPIVDGEQYCYVESDYKTAEVYGVGYQADDEELIKVLTEPDEQFALLKSNGKPVRVKFNSNTDLSDPTKFAHLLKPMTLEEFILNEDGSLKHPRRDVHWELTECRHFTDTPRELLNADSDRGAGKVGIFSAAYDASAGALERKIEVAIGRKPNQGTGERVINAYMSKFSKVKEYMDRQRRVPIDPGYIISISGAKRHFRTHRYSEAEEYGLTPYEMNSLMDPLTRQAINWPIQSLIADSLAKAVVAANLKFKQLGMKARVCVPQYDSLVTLCPVREAEAVKRIHQEAMVDINHWTFPSGKTLVLELDTQITFRWSCKMDDAEKAYFKECLSSTSNEVKVD